MAEVDVHINASGSEYPLVFDRPYELIVTRGSHTHCFTVEHDREETAKVWLTMEPHPDFIDDDVMDKIYKTLNLSTMPIVEIVGYSDRVMTETLK